MLNMQNTFYLHKKCFEMFKEKNEYLQNYIFCLFLD